MSHGFQQQPQDANLGFSKSCATPQHGRKPDAAPAAPRKPRRVEPHPGH